jgi:hypothetical protein
LLAVVSAFGPGTASAEPDSDRSLNADKPVTVPSGATNIPAGNDASAQAPKPVAGDNTPAPDLSTLSREQLEARVKTLTDNLASANTESEYFREQWSGLKLRDEALGVEALTGDQSQLEDKLVQAVKELYQERMRRRESLVLLNELLVSTDMMLATAPNYDPKLRAQYEEATRSAKAYLSGNSGAAIPIATSLDDGKIADTNPDLNAVILNMGKTQGVKEGMHFSIFQDNVEVGSVKVMVARDLISSAAVERLKPKTVLKVGDRAAVQAQ